MFRMEDRDHKSRGRSAREERIEPEDATTRVNPTEVGKELATIDTDVDRMLTNNAAATQALGRLSRRQAKKSSLATSAVARSAVIST